MADYNVKVMTFNTLDKIGKKGNKKGNRVWKNHGVIEEAARQGVSIIGLRETGGEYVSQTRGRTNRNDDWEKLLTGYDPKYYNPSKQWQTATNSAQNMRIAWDPSVFKLHGRPV